MSGLDTSTAIVPYSRKSYPPDPSLSAGNVYPSDPEVTRPSESTVTGEFPSSPSSSPSVNPASTASRQPSPSESRSKWLGIPSPSVSAIPVSMQGDPFDRVKSPFSELVIYGSVSIFPSPTHPPSISLYVISIWLESDKLTAVGVLSQIIELITCGYALPQVSIPPPWTAVLPIMVRFVRVAKACMPTPPL